MNSKHFNKEELSDYADNKQSFAERVEISLHLSTCAFCQNNLRQIDPQLDEKVGRNFLISQKLELETTLVKSQNLTPAIERKLMPDDVGFFSFFKSAILVKFNRLKKKFAINRILKAKDNLSSLNKLSARAGLHMQPIVLMDGSLENPDVPIKDSVIIWPVNEVISQVQPTLSWRTVPQAISYEVGVFSCRTNKKVDGGFIKGDVAAEDQVLTWQVREKLIPGEVYAWQVRVQTQEEELKFPRLPVREIRFQVAAQKIS